MKPNDRQEQSEEIDPLIEAEALRTALGVAHQRLSRLLIALKSIKKDKKTFTQVLTSLQSLKLR